MIASQAIISGVFSLTQQSIQLGFLPRMQIRHTTSDAIGQIYVPLVNWLLAAARSAPCLPSAPRTRWPAPTASRCRC